ncbi:MAG: ABC transporter permease [Candidatus Heimdallarchaeota archaeon]|nr:MAG: ABC transporter permease [Candidatus Heimdallarchaeota archaeon]
MAEHRLDEAKLEELEKEKQKRRRVGRLMVFWRRFRRHRMGVFGLSIIVFITLLAIFADFLAGTNGLIPYGPSDERLEAQYVAPFGFELNKDRDASLAAQGKEKTLGAVYYDREINFTNGISQQNLTHYQQLSQIDSIESANGNNELWTNSEGDFDHDSGQITLTDNSFSGTALVDYRVAGKCALRITPYKSDISQIKMWMKVATDYAELSWPEPVDLYIFEDGVDFDTGEAIATTSIDGHKIVSGPGAINPTGVTFNFGYKAVGVTPQRNYWLVLDTNLIRMESPSVDLRLFMDSGSDPLDPLNLMGRGKNWNNYEKWEGTTIPEEGELPRMNAYFGTNKFHLLGTDSLGRDILSATIHGARTSLIVAFVAISIRIVIGLALGSIAGYYGGKIDNAIMRLTDVFLAIPFFFLILIAITIWEQVSLIVLSITLGLFGWSQTARIVRAEFLHLREMEYTDAAKSLGVSDRSIIFKHLLPNAMAPVIVTASLGVATVILIEAGLSFLGFGDPLAISWGTAIQWGIAGQSLRFAPWVATIPGLAIFVAVVGFNLLGDALRDALDPRLKN